jgi:imidazolonepropionase-like amidohydrolase
MNEVGMSEIECIQSATVTNAVVLGQENQIGKIKKGFIADIIATDLNPLDDISVLENIVFVMKDGIVHKN